MILTTTLLIVVTVVGSGVLNVINIRRAFDESARQQIEVFRAGRETAGEFGTPLFARAVEQLIIDRGRDVEILALVRQTVAQDTKEGPSGKKDYGLKLAYVLDPSQKMVARCFEEAKLDCGPGNHEPVGPAFGKLTVETWNQALAQWKTAAAARREALVRFDTADASSHYQVFAYPVFTGIPATAAGAIAPEPPEQRQGYVVLGYDLAPIDWFASAAAEQKATASTRAALYTGAVGALFALIGTVLAILQGLSISRPIKALAWRADQIARGDLGARVEITSSDEIGLLGENFNFMADQISILLEQTAEKARLEQELEIAKTIQDTLVPSAEPVDHGVPSAMITAAAKAACDVARYVYRDDVTVSGMLEIMNHAIFESAQRRFVMTCFASIFDPHRRTITYANAGHNFPYLFRAGDGRGEFGSLMIRGNRLGDDRNSRYEAKTTDLVPGDVLIWYTDGIVECENAAGEEYGEKRFRASVRRAAALDAGEMRDAIIGDASAYFGDTPRKDDITMIVGRIH